MNEVITYETEFGEIQIETHKPAIVTRGGESTTIKKKFENAIGVVKSLGNSIVQQVQDLAETPDEVSVEVGIKFSVEAGAIIAKTSSEGTLKLNMTWKKDKKEAS